LDNFQILELLSLQGATIGGFGIKHPFLCNGANLCYKKNCFLELYGFSGNDNIASGDDVFILEKMLKKYPNKVKYLKSKGVIVRTKVEKRFSDMIHQRIRWAAKTTSFENSFGKLVGLIVLLMNFWLILLLLFAILNTISWQQVGYAFFIKFVIDLLLLYPTSVFYQQQKILKNYFIVSFLYPFFNVYVAVLSFRKSYDWKGRTFSK
jgi:cellulose synthase/poly-beta-1,6-N-acetylglucosamine synthase-like glycosyltransferase